MTNNFEAAGTASVSLLRRFQGGESRALNELLDRYRPRIERIALARLGPKLRTKVDVQDVVQEVLVRAIDGLDDFELREDAALIDWLARLVQNEVIRLARHFGADKRDLERENPMHGQRPAGDDSTLSPDLILDSCGPRTKAEQRELETIIDDCLSLMDEAQREIILLRDYAHASWEFVAEQLKTSSVGAAQQLHRRAWAKLVAAVERRL